jgi:hypothetical protein
VHVLSFASRLVAAGLFVLALAAFSRPFVSLFAGERVGTANGLELALGSPELSGRYGDPALRGEIERRFDRAELPALLALAAAAAGLLAVFLPGRTGPGLGLLASLGALASLAVVLAVTSSPDVAVATDRRYAFWYAGIALAGAGLFAGLALVSRAAEPGGRLPPRSRPRRRG